MLLLISENDTDFGNINASLVGSMTKSSFCTLVFRASLSQLEIRACQVSLDKYSLKISATQVRRISAFSVDNSRNDSRIINNY